jgi:hypothetical protein
VDCTVHSTIKGLKRKREKKNTRHELIFFSCIKNIRKKLRSKSVRFFCKNICKSFWPNYNTRTTNPLSSPQSFWPSIQIFSCLIVANSWDPKEGNEKIKTKGNNDDRNAWWSRKKNSQREKSGKCGIYLLKKNTVIENIL